MKLLLIISLFTTILLSAPALNVEREFTQADGSTFRAKGFGNHHLNWIETSDGEVLKYSRKNRNFEYAMIEDATLKASGTAFVKSNSKRARSLAHVNKVDKKKLYQLWSQKRKEAHERRQSH